MPGVHYSEKVYPRVFSVGLLSFVVSAGFAFSGWYYSGDSVAVWVTLLLVACAFLLTVSVFQYRLDLLAMGQAMHARVGADRLNGPVSQARLIRQLSKEYEVHTYCSEAFCEYLVSELKIPDGMQSTLAQNLVLLGPEGTPNRFREIEKASFVPSPAFCNMLILMSRSSENAERAIVCSDPIDRVSVWYYIDDRETAARFASNCKGLQVASFEDLCDPQWLLSEVGESRALWASHMRFGHVPATNKEELGKLQERLTEQATESVLGFDLTEVSLWYAGGRMEPVLRNNWTSVANGVDVRRIFGFPSRRSLDRHEAQLLAGVLRGHQRGGVECGVVFEDEWPDEKISDFAVYDRSVAWVETARGREHVGGGYFTTNREDVTKRLELFDEVWQNSKRPVTVAAELVLGTYPDQDLDYGMPELQSGGPTA